MDFAQIANHIGCVGYRVEDPEKIAEVLEKALNIDAPVVVDVVTDPGCRAPWMPAY